MTIWLAMGESDWRRHPLNRLRGWLLAILVYLVIFGVLPGSLVILGAALDPDMFAAMTDPALPGWFADLSLVLPGLSSIALVVMIAMKSAATPMAFAVLRGLNLVVAQAGYVIIGAWPLPMGMMLAGLGFLAVEIAAAVYLFRGERPNIVFARRVAAEA